MKTERNQVFLAAALLCAGLTLPTFAQEQARTDLLGTIDEETAAATPRSWSIASA